MMLVNYFLVLYCLTKNVIVESGDIKGNIRGRKAVYPEKKIHQYDYRKHYKDQFKSIDVHPIEYGKPPIPKKTVPENIDDDDAEQDKHTLIFNQVYHFYKKMLNRRKTKVEAAKENFHGQVEHLEKVMKRKLNRIDHLNHNELTREREVERIGDKIETFNGIHRTNTKEKVIDVSKVNNVLDDVENYVHNKVGIPKEDDTSQEAIRNDGKQDLKDKMVNLFGVTKKAKQKLSNKPSRGKTTTTKPTTPDLIDWGLNHTDDSDSSQLKNIKGDGYWDRIKNRRVNLTRRQRMKTTMSSSEAIDYWRAWTPDPRYTFGLEEWNGSAVMNQTFFSYEEENATFTTLPANWLTWLYSGVSEDLANRTEYVSCPTHEIYDRYYNASWSTELQHTAAKNHTFYWPNKDMFKYTFHTSDASEWDEPEFMHYPPNPTYYERNLVTEYLTWHPVKRKYFMTTKFQPKRWTELYYTNNSAEQVYVAPTVYWEDWRTPSLRTFGSWEQVESKEHTRPPRTLPPYPDPPINYTCYHCNGTPAIFSHENNLNNHIVEHIKNDTYKLHYNSSEERRANELPVWDGHFMLSHDSELARQGITQTRYKDATYLSSIDYSHEMRNWNQSFIDRMIQRHKEGKPVQDWDRDSVVYQYYEDKVKSTTVIYGSDYYYNSEEWDELQKYRARQAEKEKLKAKLNAYMAQELTTFPDSFTEPSEEFEKKKKEKKLESLELFKREYLRNLTRSTKPTTAEPMLDLMKEMASLYRKFGVTITTTTTRKRRPVNIQEQINKYAYSDTLEDYRIAESSGKMT